MTDVGVALGFWSLGAVTVGAALGILLTNNLLHAVLFLILSFVALAGLFLTLTADFIAVAQVLIYAGAVGVLVVFAIMLTPRTARSNADTVYLGPGFVVAGLVATVMGFVAFRTPWNEVEKPGFDSTVAAIGAALVDRWAVPFEIASILLIAAMIGAIVLVRASEPGAVDRAAAPAMDVTDERRDERALAPTGSEVDVSVGGP